MTYRPMLLWIGGALTGSGVMIMILSASGHIH